MTDIIEQGVMPASDFGECVHHLLHNSGCGRIERVDSLTRLEVDIWILGSAAQNRMLRVESSCSMGTHQILVKKGAQFFIRNLEDLGNLVRGPKPVKEMN